METLSALITREGKLSAQEAAGWVLRFVRRIEATHRQGLVHGNVSAYSLLIESRSPISRGLLIDSPRQAEAAYFSPERAASGQTSQADDTWATAVTFFFALTGQFPFQVHSAIDIARAVALGVPKVTKHGINDPALQAIFDRFFARDIAKRTVDISSFQQALAQWARDPRVTDLPPLEDDDEDAPTMMMQQVSVASAEQQRQQMAAPKAPLPGPPPAIPRPAAGLPPPPDALPGLSPAVAASNPRHAPTLLAVREPEPEAGPFSKGTLTVLFVVWFLITFGGAAVEYVVLTKM